MLVSGGYQYQASRRQYAGLASALLPFIHDYCQARPVETIQENIILYGGLYTTTV
jgi:hypothetical protein